MHRTNRMTDSKRRYYSRYLAHYTKKHYGLLALGGLFLLGVLIGTLLLRTAGKDTVEFLLRIVGSFVDGRGEQSLLENFRAGASSSLLFLAILFVCGFCAVAQPVILLMPLFRGLGVGASIASIYAAYGAQAIGYVALLLLPGTALTTVVMLLCCRESLRMASSFWQSMKSAGEEADYSMRLYLARYLVCASLCCIAALAEAVLVEGFSGLFPLG